MNTEENRSVKNVDVEPFNLTPAQLERLAILAEECGEVIQVVNKIIRHGYESYNPYDKDETPNRVLLTRECGDVAFAIAMLAEAEDVNMEEVVEAAGAKEERIGKYLHYNKI